jgi:hypothetical protein
LHPPSTLEKKTMSAYVIMATAIVAGCFVLISVSAIFADLWNKERARQHEEKMKHLEIEKLKQEGMPREV